MAALQNRPIILDELEEPVVPGVAERGPGDNLIVTIIIVIIIL